MASTGKCMVFDNERSLQWVRHVNLYISWYIKIVSLSRKNSRNRASVPDVPGGSSRRNVRGISTAKDARLGPFLTAASKVIRVDPPNLYPDGSAAASGTKPTNTGHQSVNLHEELIKKWVWILHFRLPPSIKQSLLGKYILLKNYTLLHALSLMDELIATVISESAISKDEEIRKHPQSVAVMATVIGKNTVRLLANDAHSNDPYFLGELCDAMHLLHFIYEHITLTHRPDDSPRN